MSDTRDPRFVSSMFPLVATKGSVGFDSIERSEIRKIINSHLKMVILTNPGEIPSDAKFGVGLYGRLFLLQNEPQIKSLKKDIRDQIDKYLPYLTNYEVLVDATKAMDHKIAVRINYVITDGLTTDTITFVVSDSTATTYVDESSGDTLVTLGEILSERV